jgi:5-methylcytosine-specific restriction endonuclease McrA
MCWRHSDRARARLIRVVCWDRLAPGPALPAVDLEVADSAVQDECHATSLTMPRDSSLSPSTNRGTPERRPPLRARWRSRRLTATGEHQLERQAAELIASNGSRRFGRHDRASGGARIRCCLQGNARHAKLRTMLRRAENVVVAHQPGFFTGRGWLTLQVGKTSYRVARIRREEFQAMRGSQQRVPVPICTVGERRCWWFQDRYFWDNDDLNQHEVYALLVTRQQREKQRIQMAQATVAIGATPRQVSRVAIPDDVKQFVFARDGGRCRQCGAGSELQFDHVIPVSLGGGSTADNLQLLCGPCNRRKSGGLTSGYPNASAQQSAASGPTPNPSGDEPWWKQPGLRG